MSGVYERELKGVLSGDPKVVERVTRSLPQQEAWGLRLVLERPFLVVRAAGSFGVDLVALRSDFSFPIEVKSASEDVLHFSDHSARNHDQAERMIEICSQASLVPLYAFRLKNARGGDPWRIFTLPMRRVPGRAGILHSRLPKASRTEKGFYVLHWREGLPLHRFLEYLHHMTAGGEEKGAGNRTMEESRERRL